jgi:hypothetical protein
MGCSIVYVNYIEIFGTCVNPHLCGKLQDVAYPYVL